jgi:hypothetical protein
MYGHRDEFPRRDADARRDDARADDPPQIARSVRQIANRRARQIGSAGECVEGQDG